MRIGLISDTHRSLDNAIKAVDKMGAIDLLIHAGDHYRDAMTIASQIEIPVKAVVGNCDIASDGPDDLLLDLEGCLVYITHGHRYQVKLSRYKLQCRALELKARVAVYGHTHIPDLTELAVAGDTDQGELLFINPGSLAEPRQGGKPSYAVLEIKGSAVNAQIYYL